MTTATDAAPPVHLQARALLAQLPQLAAQAPPEQKGLSGTTVLLLILVAFILGGAIAAYVAKTYLVKTGSTLEGLPSKGLDFEGTRRDSMSGA